MSNGPRNQPKSSAAAGVVANEADVSGRAWWFGKRHIVSVPLFTPCFPQHILPPEFDRVRRVGWPACRATRYPGAGTLHPARQIQLNRVDVDARLQPVRCCPLPQQSRTSTPCPPPQRPATHPPLPSRRLATPQYQQTLVVLFCGTIPHPARSRYFPPAGQRLSIERLIPRLRSTGECRERGEATQLSSPNHVTCQLRCSLHSFGLLGIVRFISCLESSAGSL